MFNIIFVHPWFLLGIPAALGIAWLHRRHHVPIEHSRVSLHKKLTFSGILTLLPLLLLALSFSAGSIALARPQVQHATVQQQVPAIDEFIAADVSGDMDDPSVYNDPHSISEFTLSVETPGFFVNHMHDARVALATFDTNTYIYWPFSTDKHVLSIEAATIAQQQQTGNWQTYDGSTGPIATAIQMFTKYSQAKTKVFVMITDADADTFVTSQQNIALATELRKLGVHMYLIVMGGDMPYSDSTDLVRFVNGLGANGHVIHAVSKAQMNAAVAQINQYERTPVNVQSTPLYADIYFPFVLAAIVCFGLSMLTKAIVRQLQ